MPSLNFAFILLLAAFTTLVSAQAPSNGTVPGNGTLSGTVINFNGNTTKALGISTKSELQNGTPVIITNAVPDGTTQRWIINRGPTKVKLVLNSSREFCLSSGGDFVIDGVLVGVDECFDNVAHQEWTYTDDNRIVVKGKTFCLDLPDGNTTEGSKPSALDLLPRQHQPDLDCSFCLMRPVTD
ncbi:hypothetical protein DFP72DRAFT_1040069 [Ephemerocybe angulata]|uniref:Ricin B lectin domain-containing protein n=1 Tax=Ephemerocybe angulata TaxID=980116 RepID=A0A8H6IEV5_9AGAR|nr:hypothetical protein DFP72DRAFT_1040069 [Tulosesus angulatus]